MRGLAADLVLGRRVVVAAAAGRAYTTAAATGRVSTGRSGVQNRQSMVLTARQPLFANGEVTFGSRLGVVYAEYAGDGLVDERMDGPCLRRQCRLLHRTLPTPVEQRLPSPPPGSRPLIGRRGERGLRARRCTRPRSHRSQPALKETRGPIHPARSCNNKHIHEVIRLETMAAAVNTQS